jgi:lipopolysaccharide/colanic/teichoic acid biosynthesis glycosyltransferase
MITSKPRFIAPVAAPTTVAKSPAANEPVLATPLVPTAPAHPAYRWSKRCFDLIVAATALVILSPLLLIIALAIKLDDGGPVIISQRRVGLGGRVFAFYKFRSMRADMDHATAHRAFAQAVIRGEITQGPRSNGGLLKPTGNGAAITRIGRILRKTSLDELPQLINVLAGQMSLVGPRPSLDYEAEAYYDHFLPRLSVLPGLTGLAQVNGRSSIPFADIVRWDLAYIEARSFWLDVHILRQTVAVVARMHHTG